MWRVIDLYMNYWVKTVMLTQIFVASMIALVAYCKSIVFYRDELPEECELSTDIYYFGSLCAVIAACSSPLLDLVLELNELFKSWRSKNKIRDKTHPPYNNFLVERTVVLLVLIIPSIVQINMILDENEEFICKVALTSTYFQSLINTSAVLAIVQPLNPDIFRWYEVLPFLVLWDFMRTLVALGDSFVRVLLAIVLVLIAGAKYIQVIRVYWVDDGSDLLTSFKNSACFWYTTFGAAYFSIGFLLNLYFDAFEVIVFNQNMTKVCFITFFFVLGSPKRLGMDLYVMRASLKQRNLFLRFLSHEIRTPLNIVSIGLTLAQMEMKAMAGVTEDVLISLDDSMRALHVAEETLSAVQHYDKLSSHLMVLDQRPVRCSELLDSTLRLFGALAAEKGVEIVVTAALSDDYSELQVEADEPKLMVVLRNLLSNALKFTPTGGSVTISKRVVDDATALAMLEGSMQMHHQTRQRPLSMKLSRAALRRKPAAPALSASSYDSCMHGWGWRCCADLIGQAMRSAALYDVAPSAGRFLLIEMTDTGVGMTPESCSRLLREVVQFDVNANQGGNGSGMGLFISNSITELHGGVLLARSEGLGRGSTLSVLLPLCTSPPETEDDSAAIGFGDLENPMRSLRPGNLRVHPEHKKDSVDAIAADVAQVERFSPRIAEELTKVDASGAARRSSATRRSPTAAAASASAASAESWFRGKHVLVADDVGVCVKMHVRLLTRLGAVCSVANDGQEALQAVKASMQLQAGGGFDLVLMDNCMPVMSGPEACREIRALGFNIPIVGLTGHVMGSDAVSFLAEGADVVLAKPVNLGELEAWLRRWCDCDSRLGQIRGR